MPRGSPLAAAAFGLVFALTIIGYFVADGVIRRQAMREFAVETGYLQDQIDRRLSTFTLLLNGLAGFVAASETVKAEEWQAYVSALALDRLSHDLVSVGYAEMVDHAGLTEFVAKQQQHAPSYAVRPAGVRDEYMPVVYLAPDNSRSQAALGRDLLAEPARRTAILQAGVSGRPTISEPLPLGGRESEPETGVAAFVDMGAGARAQRHRIVFVEFTAAGMLSGILRGADAPVTFDIYDGAAIDPANRLFRASTAAKPSAIDGVSPFVGQRSIEIMGRTWTMAFQATPAFAAARDLQLPRQILLAGAGFSLFLGAIAWAFARVHGRTEALARRLAGEMTRSQARFQDLFAHAPDAVVLVRPDGVIADVNLEAEDTFGYGRDELIGRPATLLAPEEVREGLDTYRATYIRDPVRLDMSETGIELLGRRKDGSSFPVSVDLVPLLDDRNPMVAGWVRDLTEKQATEAQLRQAQKMESIGRLSGGIAHDFNNLLTVVVSNLDLVLEQQHDETARVTMLQAALASALRGAELTRKLLAFARPHVDMPSSQRAETAQLAERLPTAVEWIGRALGESVHIELDLAQDLWPARAEIGQVEDVLLNLALNARDAMLPDGGTLVIEARNTQIDDEYALHNPGVATGDYVLLTCTDSGMGMPPDVLERAFEPFFTTKAPGSGTGLGLSMIHSFAKQSGGHAKLYSEVGHGTTVSIYLPRAVGPAETAAAPPAPDVLPRGSESILLVEDDERVRNSTRQILGELGYDVTVAGTGPEALRILDSGRHFELLFTDVVMPEGMNGYELAAAARERHAELPVLISTGYARGARMDKAASSYAILRKPYRRHELAARVRAALDNAP